MKEFNPMITLRYSATHRADSIYNMVYRLDAMEAYNKRLVKKIVVKGITESAVPLRMGLSIWKASIFPKLTRQQPFSLTA